jgi:hypothetical protein
MLRVNPIFNPSTTRSRFATKGKFMSTMHLPALGTSASSVATTLVKRANQSAMKAWFALHRFGQRRAAARLMQLALQYDATDVALARRLRQAAAECEAGARATL